ncbi:MAG: hypothetical protein F6K47_09740 [Symploca sp. SIO2E6]|nr:hypothetical protein [Symploca sp. SIO2E6]
MTQDNTTKLNYLLRSWPPGEVITSKWLTTHGYTPDLVKRYQESSWLESLGHGAWTQRLEDVTWVDGVHAIQTQLNLPIFVVSESALRLGGYAHYLPFSEETIFLMGQRGTTLPKWFREYPWKVRTVYKTSSLFGNEPSLGIQEIKIQGTALQVSSPERAILEVLYAVPKDFSFEFAWQHFESLLSLRPSHVQRLLEECTSIKAKRLFLLLAEKLEMPWRCAVSRESISLGSGKRVLAKGGMLNKMYQITVPSEWIETIDD